MNPNDTLHLVLSKKWYDMIEAGEKREEYRRICSHWRERITRYRSRRNKVTFQLGYRKDAPRMTFGMESISLVACIEGAAIVRWTWMVPPYPNYLGTVSPEIAPECRAEWGFCEPSYVIRFGKRIKENKKQNFPRA